MAQATENTTGLPEKIRTRETDIRHCEDCTCRYDALKNEGRDDGVDLCWDCDEAREEKEDPEYHAEAAVMSALLEYSHDSDQSITGIQSFEQAGILTRNKGVVLKIDGKKYQLTIVAA